MANRIKGGEVRPAGGVSLEWDYTVEIDPALGVHGPRRPLPEEVLAELAGMVAQLRARDAETRYAVEVARIRRALKLGIVPESDFFAGLFEEQRCRVCGCIDDDCSGCVERTGQPCSWVDLDLCSACAPEEGVHGG